MIGDGVEDCFAAVADGVFDLDFIQDQIVFSHELPCFRQHVQVEFVQEAAESLVSAVVG